MTSVDLRAMFQQYGVGEGGFDQVPVATYKVKLTGIKPDEKNGVWGGAEIMEGPYAGKKVKLTISMGQAPTESSVRAFNSKVAAWGFTDADWPASTAELAQRLEGRVANVGVEDNLYNGRTTSQIGFNVKLLEAPAVSVGGVPNIAAVAPPTATVPVTAPAAAPAPPVALAPTPVAAPAEAGVAAAPVPPQVAAGNGAAPVAVPGIQVTEQPNF